MKIVVHVTEAALRGTPFRKYEGVLGELIGEAYPDVDETEIVLGDRAEVTTTGHSDPVAASKAARAIPEMAQETTDPQVRTGTSVDATLPNCISAWRAEAGIDAELGQGASAVCCFSEWAPPERN